MDEIILNQNPWWEKGKIDLNSDKLVPREDLINLEVQLNDPKISTLLGPRRGGKTTLMYELIEKLLEQGVNPKRILFISFDNPKVREMALDEIFSSYQEFLGGSFRDANEKTFVFLDEIQKLSNFGDRIKYWQDLGLPVKFILSGSSAARILLGAGESLLGRSKINLILPLSFKEIIIHQLGLPKASVLIDNSDSLQELFWQWQPHQSAIQYGLSLYLKFGGYPEVIQSGLKDTSSLHLDERLVLLRDYKTLTLSRDIFEEEDVRDIQSVNDLFDLLSDYLGNRVNLAELGRLISAKQTTVKNYLNYFQRAYLLSLVSAFSKSLVVNTRKQRKVYFFDNGLRNAFLLKDLSDSEMGHLAENSVFIHLFSNLKKELLPKIFYWQEQDGKEVDFVVLQKQGFLPLEIKFQQTVGKEDVMGLAAFCQNYPQSLKGIVITKEKFAMEGGVRFIPLWLFLAAKL